MQSFDLQDNYQTPEDASDDDQSPQEQYQQYKQDLGLKKMIYKYQHENEQLRTQIKALTSKLSAITTHQSPKENPQLQAVPNAQKNYNNYWAQQLQVFHSRINEVQARIKTNKQKINEDKEQQYNRAMNRVNNMHKQLESLRAMVDKYNKQQSAGNETLSGRNRLRSGQDEQTIKEDIVRQLEQSRKKIRQLERKRNQIQRDIRVKHQLRIDLEIKNRDFTAQNPQNASRKVKATGEVCEQSLPSSPRKFGLWGMGLTEENYNNVKLELEGLKKQKANELQSLKTENNHFRQRIVELKNQYINLSANGTAQLNSSHLLANRVRNSRITQSAITSKEKKESNRQSFHLPDSPPLSALEKVNYQPKNDKNYSEQKIKTVEWVSRDNKGLNWNDEPCKSPITGINLWIQKYVIGIQFLHTLGESVQHLHIADSEISRNITPTQYRLNSNDYLENVILVIAQNLPKKQNLTNSIVGIELVSKNGRKDHFGYKIGSAGTRKFDFGIQAPQKPIYSYGSFVINSATRMSCITKLGFAIV